MALIRTIYGDTLASTTLSRGGIPGGQNLVPFMDVTEVNFSLPIDNDLVQIGAFNAWMPIAVRIQDGDEVNGGSNIDIACWPVLLERADNVLNVTAYDAAKWLERRTAVRVSSSELPAGEHFLGLFANAIENAEERSANQYATYLPSDSAWPYSLPTQLNAVHWGTQWVGAAAVNSGHTSGHRQCTFTLDPFSTASAPTTVKLRIFSDESPGVVWSNTIAVSVDGGTTWDTAHAIPAQSSIHETWIDLTADHSWLAADLSSITIRCTVEADADYAGSWDTDHTIFDGPRWAIYHMAIRAEFATTAPDAWPIIPTGYDTGGPLLTLPAERKTLRAWLDWMVDQGAGEWAIQSDWNHPGVAGLSFASRIGSDLAASVVIGGQSRQVAALEEHGLIAAVTKVQVNGEELFSRIRITATGLPDVVVENSTLINDPYFGVQEIALDLGTSTAAEQADTAAAKLDEIGHPVMVFQFTIARIPGLWAALVPGTTAICWIEHAPIKSWEGVIRIVGWSIDDQAGTVTIDALSVQDHGASSQPITSGYQVQSTAAKRTSSTITRRVRRFRDLLMQIGRLSR